MDTSRSRPGEPRFFLGIDGGQSSTVAVIVNGNEEIVGRGVAGPSDHIDEAPDSRRCADACEAAAAAARDAAGLSDAAPFAAVVVGLSGYDGRLHGVQPHFRSDNVRYVHDAPIALAGAVDRRPAVAVIAGTGSVAYAEDAGRRASIRVGGYGYLFGDEGSSFVLAREALSGAMRQADAGAPSRLGDAALAYFDRADLRALARAFYLKEIGRPELASFARVVLDAARLGDADADALVDRAADALAFLAATAIARLGLEATPAVPVALVGGLFGNADLCRRMTEKLAERAANARVVKPLHEPAVGAARLAMDNG